MAPPPLAPPLQGSRLELVSRQPEQMPQGKDRQQVETDSGGRAWEDWMAELGQQALQAPQHTCAITTVTFLCSGSRRRWGVGARRDVLVPLEPGVCWCLHREWN